MAAFRTGIEAATETLHTSVDAVSTVSALATAAGYTIVDSTTTKPWGGFIRFQYRDGDRFIREFFPEIDPIEARLGNPEAELSPKILIVDSGERLSWQRHARRAERWAFLTPGGYHKSVDPDSMGDLTLAQYGDVVQFAAGECHRLVGAPDSLTLVAEIWQHTDDRQLSDEDDIERLSDDYQR